MSLFFVYQEKNDFVKLNSAWKDGVRLISYH